MKTSEPIQIAGAATLEKADFGTCTLTCVEPLPVSCVRQIRDMRYVPETVDIVVEPALSPHVMKLALLEKALFAVCEAVLIDVPFAIVTSRELPYALELIECDTR